MVRKYPGAGTEYWCARDLQVLLGYTQWRNFAAVMLGELRDPNAVKPLIMVKIEDGEFVYDRDVKYDEVRPSETK